jgi:hypothetical protein
MQDGFGWKGFLDPEDTAKKVAVCKVKKNGVK